VLRYFPQAQAYAEFADVLINTVAQKDVIGLNLTFAVVASINEINKERTGVKGLPASPGRSTAAMV